LTSRATWIVGGAPVPKARLSTPTTLLPGTVILRRVMGSSALTPQKEPRDVQGAVVDPITPFAPETSIVQVPLRKYVTRSAPTAAMLPPGKAMTKASRTASVGADAGNAAGSVKQVSVAAPTARAGGAGRAAMIRPTSDTTAAKRVADDMRPPALEETLHWAAGALRRPAG